MTSSYSNNSSGKRKQKTRDESNELKQKSVDEFYWSNGNKRRLPKSSNCSKSSSATPMSADNSRCSKWSKNAPPKSSESSSD